MTTPSKKADREPVITFPVPVKSIKKIGPALSKLASEGYGVINSCFVPTTDGGLVLYVLGDVSEPEAEAIEEETAASTEPETLAATTIVEHNGSNGNGAAELPEPSIVGAPGV